MNQQKLQHLMTLKVDDSQKVKCLELWNLTPAFCMVFKFLRMFISYKDFDLWLYKSIF